MVVFPQDIWPRRSRSDDRDAVSEAGDLDDLHFNDASRVSLRSIAYQQAAEPSQRRIGLTNCGGLLVCKICSDGSSSMVVLSYFPQSLI